MKEIHKHIQYQCSEVRFIDACFGGSCISLQQLKFDVLFYYYIVSYFCSSQFYDWSSSVMQGIEETEDFDESEDYEDA